MWAPPPPPTPQIVVWNSGEDVDDVMSTKASNSQFQVSEHAFRHREDPVPELSFQGAEPASVGAKDGSGWGFF